MTIGEVSKETGISIDTLRYYEKLGLMGKVNKLSGKRNYDESNLQKLEFIMCMKNAGLSLKDIGKFMEYNIQGDSTINLRLEILRNQRDILKKEISDKNKTLDYLNYKINLYEKRNLK